jgi:glycosyltransferase involved in cell wall biosynthesis
MVTGLVHALGKLMDGDEEYVILTLAESTDWLAQHLGRNEVVQKYPVRKPRGIAGKLASTLAKSAYANSVKDWGRARLCQGHDSTSYLVHEPAQSDGFLESLGLDVIHFPFHDFVRTSIPSVFNPWDLQHLHYPHFFPSRAVALREAFLPIACREASRVVAGSDWIKNDIIEKYGTEPDKVQVVPVAPATEVHQAPTADERRQILHQYRLTEHYAFYPAQTWPHKNHLRLLQAIAALRDERALHVNLVCTGLQNEYWPRIEQEIDALALREQVNFLGFVPARVVRALYASALFVVLPSLFEGGCLPMLEAFHEGVPVACAAVTHLPDQAKDAALLFDPTSIPDIAKCIARLATDATLREELRERGRNRLQLFTWARIAPTYRALYREVAGLELSAGDRDLLRGPVPVS